MTRVNDDRGRWLRRMWKQWAAEDAADTETPRKSSDGLFADDEILANAREPWFVEQALGRVVEAKFAFLDEPAPASAAAHSKPSSLLDAWRARGKVAP